MHIVTVNDYLAKRDARVDGQGLPLPRALRRPDHPRSQTLRERRAAYAADITYGTNNEFGFDYLRDNMAIYKQENGAARA